MRKIAENTIDIEVHVYPNAHDYNYRWSVRTSPDFPDSVDLSYEELAHYENRTRSAYEKKSIGNFDKDEWEKIKYAIDTVFGKTI